MHPMKRLTGALLALFLLLIPLGVLAEESAENLIWNPEIDSLDYWYEDAWDFSDGISRFALADIGYDDSSSLYVENIQVNDARYVQDIWVEPDTLYRISCYVMAEGCGEDADGANLAVKDTFAASDTLHDTNGQWQYLELYGETGPDQTELTVMARVGGYGSTNTGKAWFDHFEMIPVNTLPEGALLYDFATPAPSSAAVDVPDEAPARNTPTLILIAVMFVVLACAGWTSVRRMNEIHPDLRGRGKANIFSVLLAICISSWVGMARQVRAQVMSLKQQEFSLAAYVIGASKPRILFKHLIINCMGPIIVNTTMMVPSAIFTEAFLAFVGIGISIPMASWGTMANEARAQMMLYPMQIVWPVAAICLTMLSLHFIGDGMSEALDPKKR